MSTFTLAIPQNVPGLSQNAGRDKGVTAAKLFADHGGLYYLGAVLAAVAPGSKSNIASRMVAGETVTVPAFTVGKLEVRNSDSPDGAWTFSLTRESLAHWGCPLCRSAHGTAMGASSQGPKSSAKASLLATNEFYYSPQSGKLFVISRTCKRNWIDAQDAEGKPNGNTSYLHMIGSPLAYASLASKAAPTATPKTK